MSSHADMKILYIHQYFRTPEQGGAIRSYYLAKGMVDYGISVEMITSYNDRKPCTEKIDGITVHYLPVHYDNSFGFLLRIFAYYRFMKMALNKARQINDIDLCYATSTPLTIGWSAMRIKKELKVPYFFEVRDLWPEAPVQMGVIRSRLLKRFLKYIEKRVYDHADKIVALSPGIKAMIEKERPGKIIEIIPNMSDIDFFKAEDKDPALEEIFGVKGKFVISYFGTLGRANHLEYLLAAANASLERGLPVMFLIVGDGGEAHRLHYLVKHFQLLNVSFMEFQNKFNLRRVLNVTDAAYVSFANRPILQTNSPNKFFDSLASGKLIITNTKGWVREICENSECGFYYDPDQPIEFVNKLIPFLKDKGLLYSFQKRARDLGETRFSKSAQIKKLIQVLN